MKINTTRLAAAALAAFSLIATSDNAMCGALETPEAASEERAAAAAVTPAVRQALDNAHEHQYRELSLPNAAFYSDADLDAIRAELRDGLIERIRIFGEDGNAQEVINDAFIRLFRDLTAPMLNALSFINVGINDGVGDIIANNIRNIHLLRHVSTQNCGITDATATSMAMFMLDKAIAILRNPEWAARFGLEFSGEDGVSANARQRIEDLRNLFMTRTAVRQEVPNFARHQLGGVEDVYLNPVLYSVIFN